MDKMGNPILVGDSVAYAQRSGNTADLRLGVVEEVIHKNGFWRGKEYIEIIIRSDKQAQASRWANEVVVLKTPITGYRAEVIVTDGFR